MRTVCMYLSIVGIRPLGCMHGVMRLVVRLLIISVDELGQ